MTSKLSKTSSNISYVSKNGTDMILTEPINGKWVYKQRVHDKRMVPIGVLNDKNQLIVMYSPHDSEKEYENNMGQVVSRYLTSFWIDKEPKETINFQEVYTRNDTEESLSHYVQIIDNLDEIQQVTTSFEGKYYALGWICGYKYEDPATVIFYDQYREV